MAQQQIITFPDLLEVLGHHTHVSICHQEPGGTFRTAVTAADQAPNLVDAHTNTADIWFGVNPVAGPPRENAGRGTAEQVEHLTALYADLDVKPGGLDSFDTAHDIVTGISELLGTRPAAITLSGHGLQPFWPLEDPPTGPDARALLRRFGRLVAMVAGHHDGQVDSVYDLARVLRVPGTHNRKTPDQPIPVVCLSDTGYPLDVATVLEQLDAYNITEQPEDREALTAILSPSAEWAWAGKTCAYVTHMVTAWATDTPTARHPWLLAQATRLAAAHRAGCLTEPGYQQAVQTLVTRFRALLGTTPVRDEHPGEISDALGWGRARISVKDSAGALAELGDHTHDDNVLTLANTPTPAATPSRHLTVVHGTSAVQAEPTPDALSTLERSEDGHAQQLLAAYADLIRYCPQRSAWLTWDGHVWQWQPPGGGLVREYAKTVARDFTQADQAAVAHKRRALSSAGTSGCLKQAETDPRVVVQLNELDQHPWHLNTPAGMVDLRTGDISPPDPAMLATRTTRVAPDFDEKSTVFEAFLADTFGDNHLLRNYIQRLIGVSLIGAVLEQLLPFAHGPGANGKSTLLEAVMHALGIGAGGYATAAPAEMLMVRKHSEHPAELAQLAGARLVVCSELDDGQKFAEARIKQLTGGDSINARFLYGQPFTFTPTHTIWLLGNHRPQARTGGMAFWRRVKLVDFDRIVPPERRDPALGAKLAAAAGHVLAWAIRGAVDYAQGGIREPDDVKAATEAYAADQDTIGRFVADMVMLTPTNPMARVSVAEFRAAYDAWCIETGEVAASPKRLTQELRDRFDIDTVKSNGRRLYNHLVLLTSEDTDTGGEKDPWSL